MPTTNEREDRLERAAEDAFERRQREASESAEGVSFTGDYLAIKRRVRAQRDRTDEVVRRNNGLVDGAA